GLLGHVQVEVSDRDLGAQPGERGRRGRPDPATTPCDHDYLSGQRAGLTCHRRSPPEVTLCTYSPVGMFYSIAAGPQGRKLVASRTTPPTRPQGNVTARNHNQPANSRSSLKRNDRIQKYRNPERRTR